MFLLRNVILRYLQLLCEFSYCPFDGCKRFPDKLVSVTCLDQVSAHIVDAKKSTGIVKGLQ
jgi:hypothetical protein